MPVRSVTRPGVGGRLSNSAYSQQDTAPNPHPPAAKKAIDIYEQEQQQLNAVNSSSPPISTGLEPHLSISTPYGNVALQTNAGGGTFISKNVNFAVPVSASQSGYNITGTQNYTYQLQGKQLVPTPTTSNEAITYNGITVANVSNGTITPTTNTVSQTITGNFSGMNQTLGTINYAPALSNGNISLAFSSFTPATVQITNVVSNGNGGKVGISYQANTSYNPTTNAISVGPALSYPTQPVNLYLNPQTTTIGALPGYNGNGNPNVPISYNVSFMPTATGAITTTNILGLSGANSKPVSSLAFQGTTYTFANGTLSYSVPGATTYSTSGGSFLGSLYGSVALAGTVAFASSSSSGIGGFLASVSGVTPTPYANANPVQTTNLYAASGSYTRSTQLSDLQRSINLHSSVSVVSNTPGFDPLSYTGKPLATQFTITSKSPIGTSISTVSESLTPLQTIGQKFVLQQQYESDMGIGNKYVQGVTSIASEQGTVGAMILGPGMTTTQRAQGLAITGIEAIGLAMPTALLAGGATTGTLFVGTVSSAATGALTTSAYSLATTGKQAKPESLILSAVLSAAGFEAAFSYVTAWPYINPLQSSQSMGVSYSTSGGTTTTAELVNNGNPQLIQAQETSGSYISGQVNTYQNIFTGKITTQYVQTIGTFTNLGNGEVLGAATAKDGNLGEINIQLLPGSSTNVYAEGGALLKSSVSSDTGIAVSIPTGDTGTGSSLLPSDTRIYDYAATSKGIYTVNPSTGFGGQPAYTIDTSFMANPEAAGQSFVKSGLIMPPPNGEGTSISFSISESFGATASGVRTQGISYGFASSPDTVSELVGPSSWVHGPGTIINFGGSGEITTGTKSTGSADLGSSGGLGGSGGSGGSGISGLQGQYGPHAGNPFYNAPGTYSTGTAGGYLEFMRYATPPASESQAQSFANLAMPQAITLTMPSPTAYSSSVGIDPAILISGTTRAQSARTSMAGSSQTGINSLLSSSTNFASSQSALSSLPSSTKLAGRVTQSTSLYNSNLLGMAMQNNMATSQSQASAQATLSLSATKQIQSQLQSQSQAQMQMYGSVGNAIGIAPPHISLFPIGVPSNKKKLTMFKNPIRQVKAVSFSYLPDVSHALGFGAKGKKSNKKWYKAVGLSRPVI